MEDKPPFQRGEVATIDPSKDVMVEDMAFVKMDAGWLFCRLMDESSRDGLLKSLGSSDFTPQDLKGKEEPTDERPDARTLFVDFDEQGVRLKDWRKFAQETTPTLTGRVKAPAP